MKAARFAFCLLAALCACGAEPPAATTPFDSGATHATDSSPFAMQRFDGDSAAPGDALTSDHVTAADAHTEASSDALSADAGEDSNRTADDAAYAPEVASDATSPGVDASTDGPSVDGDPTDSEPDGPPPCGELRQPCCPGYICHSVYVCAQGTCD